MRKVLTFLVMVAAVAGGGYWYVQRASARPIQFKTAPVLRGELQLTISATGVVQPEEVVDVGAQVAGMIKGLGEDPQDSMRTVDYGSAVEQGTVLARIDDALFVSDVDQAEASVEQAKANQQKAEADLQQLRAKLRQAERDWQRAQVMRRTPGTITEADYDMYQANFESAQSLLAVGEASVNQAKKAVHMTEAGLAKAQKNLGYCTIQSPVKGVIIDRRVNVGQTVVSSLNAPSLFLIAKDLKRMQVWVSVNEADIGQIRPGLPVSFTVDAYPGETFRGVVGKVRLNATMTQNVVTYTVEVNTDNSSGKLLPYLTANALFEVGRHDNVLLVPNAALRWWPQPEQIAPDARESRGKARRKDSGAKEAIKDPAERGTVWVRDGQYVRPMQLTIGWSDGNFTELRDDTLPEETQVVTGESRLATNDAASNPFAPKMFGGGGKSSQ
jgi:HlyD family secretion protein